MQLGQDSADSLEPPDASSDAASDAESDAAPDVETDAAPDAETDAQADAQSDALTYTELGLGVRISMGVMIAIGLVTSILMLRGYESNSYTYLAFYSIPANTAISVFPHEPVLIYFGQVADLFWSAFWASIGTIVAGILDHVVFVPVLNLQSIAAYKEKPFYQKAIGYFMRWPFATIVVTGFTPIPFFPFKFLCFSIGYPMWKYVTALVVARFPRYYLLALIGATFPIPTWILVASVAVVFGLYGVKAVPAVIRRIRARRRAKRPGESA